MKRLLFWLGGLCTLAFCLALQFYVGVRGDLGPRPELSAFIIYELRLPRVVIALLVGSTLALVGGSFQALFRNPLATPSTVGTTAGATLGALLALTFGWSGTWGVSAVTSFAFAGALATTGLVLAVATRSRALIEEVLLAGIAITLSAGAISQGLHVVADQATLFAAAQWSLGQLPQVGYDRVLLLTWPVAICQLILLTQKRGLLALSWGEERAQSLGVHTRRLRLTVLCAGSLGVGASVALCGPIAFVGLLVPHLVRRSLGEPAALDLATIAFFGAVFLLLSDTAAHFAWPGVELPVGVITASLGAPALFLLILRRSSRPEAG